MIQDPVRRSRIRSILTIVIIATIPCYLLGLIVLWISNGARNHATATPTLTVEVIEANTPAVPTLPIPTAIFDTPTVTTTPTISVTPSPTSTYFIPSSTPTLTQIPSETPMPTTEVPITTPVETIST